MLKQSGPTTLGNDHLNQSPSRRDSAKIMPILAASPEAEPLTSTCDFRLPLSTYPIHDALPTRANDNVRAWCLPLPPHYCHFCAICFAAYWGAPPSARPTVRETPSALPCLAAFRYSFHFIALSNHTRHLISRLLLPFF